MADLKQYLYVFLISMVPVIELRGAIPIGAGLGLHFIPNYLVAVLGNLLPVPFILLLIRTVLAFMKRHGIFPRLVNWIENKAQKGAQKIERRAALGLFLFVALPIPGTGAWTGSLIAALFGMNRLRAFLSILAGVLVAGVIMSLASYGILGALSFLL